MVERSEAWVSSLGVDTIDSYQIHRFDPRTPLEETLGAPDQFVRQGRARYMASGTGPGFQQHARALKSAQRSKWARSVTMRKLYILLCRDGRAGNNPLCCGRRRGVRKIDALDNGLRSRDLLLTPAGTAGTAGTADLKSRYQPQAQRGRRHLALTSRASQLSAARHSPPPLRSPMRAESMVLVIVVASRSLTAQVQSPIAHPSTYVQASTLTRDDLVGQLERERANVLAYVDATPDSVLVYRPTPGVRTFAQQVDHIVSTDILVAQLLRPASTYPVLGDTGAYFHTKPALRAYVVAAYEYTSNTLRAASADQMLEARSLFQQPPAPVWRWFAMAHEHAAWTLGQTVPYLRLNHVAPPSYQLPF
ncbi:MAG: hypothetical protein NVS4B3_03180 [Gemmatimonadaceae bacterium]